MTSLLNQIGLALDAFESEGFGKIYEQHRSIVSETLQDFWIDVLSNLDTSGVNFFYDSISDFFITTQSYFGKTLETSGSSVKHLLGVFIRIVSTGAQPVTIKKYKVFLEYFNSTIDTLVEENSTVDSNNLLRIIEFYAPTSTRKQTVGFTYEKATPSNFKRFSDIYKSNVLRKINELSTVADDINSPIADSSIVATSEVWDVSDEILSDTWAREGKKLANDLRKLKQASEEFGGSEASVSGSVEVVAQLSKIINLVCFATYSGSYTRLQNKNIFGDFYSLYSSKKEPTTIYGLKFLEPFLNLKSFHTETPLQAPYANKIVQKYYNGFPEKPAEPLQAKDTPPLSGILNILKIGLTNLISECNSVGDLVDRAYNSLDRYGSLKNYKGLGNIKYILEMLKELFVPTYLTSSAGLSATFNYFANSFYELTDNVAQTALDESFVEKFVPFLQRIQSHLDSFKSTIDVVGLRKGELISNINARLATRTKSDAQAYFKRNRVQSLSEITSFEQLLEKYADDFVDSQDVISFFKAYDLVEHLYLWGGESSVFSFLDFLNNASVTNIRRVYQALERNLSKYEYVDRFKYGKLVGTLLHINRAANLDSFMSYAAVLKAKNSDLFESVKFLDTLQIDPLKDPSSLELVDDFINQLSSGTYNYVLGDIGCQEALSKAPLVVRKWVGIFDSAQGSANKSLITGMFDQNFGLTPTELETYFKTSENKGLSTLGGLLSGLRGGEFTKLLTHLELSGSILVKSPPSYKRFAIEDDLYLKELYNKIDNISRLLSLVYNRILVGFNLNSSDASSVVEQASRFITPALLPPGLGGSATKFDFITNYISPDRVISTTTTSDSEQIEITMGANTQSEYARKFIKSDFYNEIASGIAQSSGRVGYSSLSTYQPKSEPTPLDLIEFKQTYLKTKIEATPIGGFTTQGSMTSLDICKQTSDLDCSELSDSNLFSAYTPSPGNIAIQRPIHNIPEPNPSQSVLANSYKNPPAYYRALSPVNGVGLAGEPISLGQIKELSEQAGLLYDYAHTSLSTLNFATTLKHPISKVKDCLEFENNLHTYIKCVNYIRCSRSNYSFC